MGSVNSEVRPPTGSQLRRSERCGPTSNGLASPQLFQNIDSCFGGQIFVIVVVDLHHGGVHTRSQALDLDESKRIVLGGLTNLNPKVINNGLKNSSGPTNLTGAGGAKLDKVLSDRLAVEHCVKGGHFVHPHRVEFQDLGNFVHGR